MLYKEMSLRQMIDFKPNEEDMASLPLDVVLYIKVSIVSLFKEDNYGFIRYLFSNPEIKDYLKDINKTVVYDFDGSKTNQERFITVFELYGTKNYFQTSTYMKELLEHYTHEADVIFDFYTHDDKEYRLSNLDAQVKLEEIANKIELKFDEEKIS